MKELVLELECNEPLYLQLYRALRSRIISGEIRPGTRLPATRTFAQRLGVSRSVVVTAYSLLTEDGYTYAHVGAGTFAKVPRNETNLNQEAPPSDESGDRAEPKVSRLVRRLLEMGVNDDILPALGPRGDSIDFGVATGSTGESRLPGDERRLEASRPLPDRGDRHPFGLPGLRQALAQLLQRARGIRCSAEQIVIVPDSQYALDLLSHTLLDSGSAVLIEDPNHPQVRSTFESHHAELLPCPVDERGLDLNCAPQGGAAPALFYVAPTDQFPTGVTMDPARRRQLLDRARSFDAMIIEDSLDTSLESITATPPWLSSLDHEGRVIHLGTMPHVPTPELRVCYLVLPESLIEPVERLSQTAQRPAPVNGQHALARLLASGLYERLARRDQRRHVQQRTSLIEEARKTFGDDIRLSGGSSAPRITLRFPELSVDDEARLARLARDLHVAVTRLSTFFIAVPPKAGLILGYGKLSTSEIREGVRRLHNAWRALGRLGTPIDR